MRKITPARNVAVNLLPWSFSATMITGSNFGNLTAFRAIFSHIFTAHAQERPLMNFRLKFWHRAIWWKTTTHFPLTKNKNRLSSFLASRRSVQTLWKFFLWGYVWCVRRSTGKRIQDDITTHWHLKLATLSATPRCISSPTSTKLAAVQVDRGSPLFFRLQIHCCCPSYSATWPDCFCSTS